ncbi:receptor-like serine/threonine-protein kinase ALE2 isoform X3 [Magnolia sinica]|uniref:receptor-like serine/threonine-protein kinase ALE2 isoform X3 n=1 Tax=Magnolia sinica TaxID=86752 RepID=UPI00265B0231|nr:receptor-like serine/threonine-protein kinase ALE2 isoform X3 [Magnolia sinica]
MGRRLVLAMVLFCIAIGSEFHGSEGSAAYLLRKLQSKSLYVPPFAYRIVLPITLGAPSKSIDMEVHLSRLIAPSMLAPHGPIEKGYANSSQPTFPAPRPTEDRTPTFEYHGKSPRTSPPGPLALPKVSVSPLPMMLPPKLAPAPPGVQDPVASAPQNAPSHHKSKEHKQSRGVAPSTGNQTPHAVDGAVPRQSPMQPKEPLVPPATHPSISRVAPTSKSVPSQSHSPMQPKEPLVPPATHPNISRVAPSIRLVPSQSPTPQELPLVPPATHPSGSRIAPITTSEPSASPVSIFPPILHGRRHGRLVAAPPREIFNHLSPASHSPTKGSSPVINPTPHEAPKPPDDASPLSNPFPKPPIRKRVLSPAPAPAAPISSHKYHARKKVISPPPAATRLFPPPSYHQGPVVSPAPSHPPMVHPKRSRQRPHGPPALNQGPSLSPIPSPFPPTVNQGAPAPLPSLAVPSGPAERQGPIHPPTVSPSAPFPKKPRMPLPSPIRALPPPPPNQDCTSVACVEPLTNTLPGSPCGCVWPIQVGLHLNVALYTFFPLVSELAQEIATGIFMKQSQVRIMGANAASQDQDKTIVLIDLVPLRDRFDNTTAFLTYEKFWHKQVVIKTNFFGDYDVLYVRYPGLPPSPPSAPASINVDGGQLANDNNSRRIQPLGVDVKKRREKLGGSLIVIIVLSSAIALVLSIVALWLLLWKRGSHACQPAPTMRASIPPTKPSGGAGSMVLGSWASSTSLSFSSSIATYTGSAKTFSAGEIEKATDSFNISTVLGEGGFGRVYSGVLEDGTKVAVKVLKRDDQQGSREFLAEVEMLSRLHHRNLVKLIGICTEEHSRCLVYELIPNGSVESHLHGVDKETAPLDWGARMKIALGSARGLAYLHEDSSPRVIHRDFKSSNILLEHDFTPKVSDFGLARSALDGGNEHISTRVMGTFGYVAPEYAMTGHLLVKSDVYSYGVVLLELLTGRKPVDMLRPPGQENLVTWARPLLTSKEGLEMIIDPSLGSNFPFDSVAKVAAIASMCVQPEVSHRPFMGEVVQALKLVCNENDEKRGASGSFSQEDLSSAQDIDTRVSNASSQPPETRSFLTADYDSGLEAERAISTSEIFSMTARITRQESGSFRRHSCSGPLSTGKNGQFWQGGVSRGSVSEHGVTLKSLAGLEGGKMWP